MLSKSFWLVCLWFANSMVVKGQQPQSNCTVDENELPEVQSGINNFIIDELGSILFPYALNQCTGNNVITTGRWYWYQCSMDSNGMSTVIKTEYFTNDCTGNGSVVATFNESDMTAGEVGHFECSGTDAYARIRLSLDSTCTNSVVIYAALGACTNMDGNSQMNFFCSANETIAQIFTLSQMMSTTFLPSSTQLLFNQTMFPTGLNQTMLPTGFNQTMLPTGFNQTLLPTGLNQTLLPTGLNQTLLPTQFSSTLLPTGLNQTILPTALNQTILPTGFNATLSTMFNATMPSLLNATMPSILNMSTSQIEIMMCADEAFCTKWIISKQCDLVTTVPFGISQGVYGIFDECSVSGGMVSSSTMMPEQLNTTFGENITVTENITATENITVTEPSIISTIMSTVAGNESGAVRPSLLFTVGMILSFFFLVSV